MAASSTANTGAQLIADIGTVFLLPSHLCADFELRDKLNEMWRLSVEGANACEGCNGLLDRYRQAYLDNCIRLTHFAAGLSADLKRAEQRAEQRADWHVDVWRDALTDAVDVTVEVKQEVHRGPYVPGGEYRETFAEYIVDDAVTIDLDDLDADCPIPRVVHADHGFTRLGRHHDCVIEFSLVKVERRRETHVAVFAAEITG